MYDVSEVVMSSIVPLDPKLGSVETISSYWRAPSIGFHVNVGFPLTVALSAGDTSVGPTWGRSNDCGCPLFGVAAAPDPSDPVAGSTTHQ